MTYPSSCYSAQCGRILCDGCDVRPVLFEYHKRRGEAADYEAQQARARQSSVRDPMTPPTYRGMRSKERREYLRLCMAQPAAWLRETAANPGRYMRPCHQLIAMVAARRIESTA